MGYKIKPVIMELQYRFIFFLEITLFNDVSKAACTRGG